MVCQEFHCRCSSQEAFWFHSLQAKPKQSGAALQQMGWAPWETWPRKAPGQVCPRQGANLCPSLRWCNEATTLPTQRFLNFCWTCYLRRSLDQEVFIQALTSAVTEPEFGRVKVARAITSVLSFSNWGSPWSPKFTRASTKPGDDRAHPVDLSPRLWPKTSTWAWRMSLDTTWPKQLSPSTSKIDGFRMVIIGCDMGGTSIHMLFMEPIF